MEKDLQISVKGMDEEVARSIGGTVALLIKALSEAEAPLDLRRMHRVIISSDFAAELQELSKSTASGKQFTFTNEDYALGVAQVCLLPKDEQVEIVVVFNGNALVPLTKEPQSDPFKWTLHIVHHELCHVHDNNKKLDTFPDACLKLAYAGKDTIIRPLAEACWSEYIANKLSAHSAPEICIKAMVDALHSGIERTKKDVDQEILSYRFHGELEDLLDVFKRHGEFLVKSAAYVLGYMDGLGMPLEELSPETDQLLSTSYFKTCWDAISSALQKMALIYPESWKTLSVYDELAEALENYYACMGLVLSNATDGRAYINVPFRPETTP